MATHSIVSFFSQRKHIAAGPLFGFILIALILAAHVVFAVEVPFSDEKTIDGDFDGAISVFSADIDGDGDTDVIGAASIGDNVMWWENSAGDGSAWAEHLIGGNFEEAQSVFAADVDGDGDTDVIGAAAIADDIIWWENNNGDGSTWTEHTIEGNFDGASSVFAADIDSDGDTDVIAAASVADDIIWWENSTGDGSVWVQHTIDDNFDGARSVFAADIDSDGDFDVIAAASIEDDITWWENTAGDGSVWFKNTIYDNFETAYSIFASDIDSDGDTDVLAAAYSADKITWWENTISDGSIWTEHTIEASFDGARAVFAADVDGDGDTDVLGAASNADDVTWWENTTIHRSAHLAVEHVIEEGWDWVTSVFAADFDKDGDMDVIGGGQRDESHDIFWWENTAGDSSAWTEHPIFDGSDDDYLRSIGDINGDGYADVVGIWFPGPSPWPWHQDPYSYWAKNPGKSSSYWYRYELPGFGPEASIVDVDNDGDMDIFNGIGSDYLLWWENATGNGNSWTRHEIDSDFGPSDSVFATDIDGDGDTDVISGGQYLAWWENTAGDGSAWTTHPVGSDTAGSVSAADIDGDGGTDVLGWVQMESEYVTSWWENLGGDCSIWTAHTIDSVRTSSILATDIDGDGDIDVIAEGAGISWWENISGNGTTWSRHTIDNGFYSFPEGEGISATDLDGDGDTDVLGADEGSDSFTWWENRGGQFALTTSNSCSTLLVDQTAVALLTVKAIHRGRAGDTAVELFKLELLFESSPGVPLTSAGANALVEDLFVYRDDGSGVFDPADTLVVTIDSLTLSEGELSVSFVDGDTNVLVEYGVPQTYFIVIQATSTASAQSPNTMILTHLTDEIINPTISSAENRDHDIPLMLEWSADFSSSTVNFRSPLIFTDGFETGDTSEWSADPG